MNFFMSNQHINCSTDVRLVGGLSTNEGRVEVLYESKEYGTSWGTICDDHWDLADAKVVCRQLGLPEAVVATTDSYFGKGAENSRIWFDGVKCKGNEASLDKCRITDEEIACGHGEDAGVVCGSPPGTACYHRN